MFIRNKQEQPINLNMIDPSSKIALKMSCVQSSGGDLSKAKELYDFFAADIQIPDYPEPKPSTIQRFAQQADMLFGWLENNGDKFIKGYNMIQMFRGKAPIPFMQAAEAATEAIPPVPPMN